MKEHPFFKSIDWDALGKKQITPPFKPLVTSDESTENFDTEFTNADLRETGIDVFDDVEDDDDEWAVNTVATDPNSTATTVYGEGSPNAHDAPTPASLNGHAAAPPKSAATATASVGNRKADIPSSTTANGNGTATANGINKTKKDAESAGRGRGRGGVAETPISSSVQDHFRGFTFQGESTLDEAMRSVGNEDVFNDEEFGDGDGEAEGDVGDDDDWEDEEPSGRYRKQEAFA